jgi:hypothetical protein
VTPKNLYKVVARWGDRLHVFYVIAHNRKEIHSMLPDEVGGRWVLCPLVESDVTGKVGIVFTISVDAPTSVLLDRLMRLQYHQAIEIVGALDLMELKPPRSFLQLYDTFCTDLKTLGMR